MPDPPRMIRHRSRCASSGHGSLKLRGRLTFGTRSVVFQVQDPVRSQVNWWKGNVLLSQSCVLSKLELPFNWWCGLGVWRLGVGNFLAPASCKNQGVQIPNHQSIPRTKGHPKIESRRATKQKGLNTLAVKQIQNLTWSTSKQKKERNKLHKSALATASEVA